MTTNDDQAVNIFQIIGEAMSAGGYADFAEFMNAAVASGFHDDENIDVAGFIAAGAPRSAPKEDTMTFNPQHSDQDNQIVVTDARVTSLTHWATDGTKTTTYKPGHAPAGYPDGTVVIEHPDGTVEVKEGN